MKKSFKHFICLFVAILCFGEMWATPTGVDAFYKCTKQSSNVISSVTPTTGDGTFFSVFSAPTNTAGSLATNNDTLRLNVPKSTEATLSFTYTAKQAISISSFRIYATANSNNITKANISYTGNDTGESITFSKGAKDLTTSYIDVEPASAIEIAKDGTFTININLSNTDTGSERNFRMYRITLFVSAASGGGGSATPTHSVTAATSTGTTTYGTVSAASTTVAEGSTTVITATPATGYRVASWAVTGTGASISPSGSSNSNTTTLTMGTADATVTVTFEEITCPTSGTVYSAAVKSIVSSNQSFAASSTTEVNASTQADITGGKLYAINGQSSAKNLITNSSGYKFCMTNNNTTFKLELDCELAAGDVIEIDYIGGSKDGSYAELGLWVATSNDRPSSAPACSASASSGAQTLSYTVTAGSIYEGASELYIHRAFGGSTYFNNISITRPASETPVCPSGLSISGTTSYTEGETISLTATLAAGNGTITYTWYKGADLSTAKSAGSIGTGTSFSKTSCTISDADYYWCEATKNDCLAASNASAYAVTVAENLDYTVTYKANGGTKADGTTASDIEATNPDKIAGCQFLPADGKVFMKWTDDAEGKGTEYLPGTSVSTSLTLYAQYTAVACDARQSISKAVLTSASEAVVTGYNNNEYAGTAKLNSLGGDKGSSEYNFGDGDVTGYKLANSGRSFLLATLAKGTFQAGDQVKIAITSVSANKRLDICAGSDKDNMLEVIRLEDIATPGIYAYTLTAADVTAINNAGYTSLGIFRASGENTNAFVYSIEITGCRSWSVYHTLTFKNADGSATIATENLAEGDFASTIAPSAPVVDDKYFSGWSESIGGTPVDMSAYTITEDKILYAVYEDCPTYGTVFKFNVATNLTSGNMFVTAPLSATALTTENFLSELVGGEMEVSNTNSNNNRIVISDQKAIGFANGTGGKITIALDCPLQENDEIRFINYAKADNSITLSDGTNSTTLDGNGNTSVQTFIVPEAWETGSHELTMVRASGTSKLTYFEIYRRPVLTSVTLEDLNLKVGTTGTPAMTLNPEGALVTSQAWAITASTATGTTINAETGEITAGEIAGQLTVQVTVNTDKVSTCTVKVVPGFEAPKPVTETTTWNWATLAVAAGNGPEISNPDTVLANYLSGDEWETLSGNVGGRPYRHNPDYMCYQGTSLSFRTTKPGILTLKVGYTSSKNVCDVSVNGHVVGSTPATPANLNSIIVPAGEVYISATSMRIYSMTFDTDLSAYTLEDNLLGGYERTVNAGNYGTICLPNSGVMSGASIFEIAYYDEAQTKIFFDEVVDGQMVAGRPYIFLPNEGETELKVYYTDNANATAGDYRGLYGFFDTSDDNAYQKLAENDYFLYNNQYYVVDYAAVGLVAVGNYRAYIKLSDVDGYPSEPAPGRRRVSMNVNGKQVATDLENVSNANAPRKVLINGRMFIMIGEKMYDVTGQIVK